MESCVKINTDEKKKEKKQKQIKAKIKIVNNYLDEARRALTPNKKRNRWRRVSLETVQPSNLDLDQLEDGVQKLKLNDDIENKPNKVSRVRDKFGEQPNFGNYLDSLCLQPKNINLALNMLLQIEDLHTMLPYCSLYQQKTRVKQYSDRLTFPVKVPKEVNIDDILSPEIDEVVFVPLMSTALKQNEIKFEVDLLKIHPDESNLTELDQRRHVRTLKEIKGNRAKVKIVEKLDEKKDKDESEIKKSDYKPPFDLEKNYNIIFRPNRFSLRVQYRALELLDDEKRKYVFPAGNLPKVESNTKLDLEIINKQICENPEQLQAVKQIVGGANPYCPYIVVGPPGTGKTTTIVEAILQLYIQSEKNHILVTTGSNSACDTVALKICEHFETNSRLIELSRQRWGMNINEKPRLPYNILRVFSNSWIKKNGFKNIKPLIVENANFIDLKLKSPAVAVLLKYNIIVVTLCMMGRLRTGIIGNWPFTHVFIDESSAITETEALIAITSVNTNKCRIIMSGDTKQLGPVVMSRVAGELGLKHSLMERLLARDCYAVKVDGSYDRTLQMRLLQNYRSHPEILRLFNHLYYNNELIPKVRMESLLKLDKLSIITNTKFPIIFEAVHGNLASSGNSKSSYNPAEVNKVMWIIFQLMKRKDINLRDIGIVSPYRLQCAKIKDELQKRNLKGIEVGTAEIYQGREKPIIIASFVKSFSHLGFVTDPQRLNVMLSRAQSLLVLIGNPRTLQQNDDFDYLIQECKRMGTLRSF